MVKRMRHDNKADSWEEKCAALQDAFRKLPIRRNETAKGISYESIIPGIACELMLMAPVSHSAAELFAVKNGLRNKKGLHKLAQKIGDVVKVLDGLSQDALDSLNYRQAALRKLKTELRIFHEVVKAAKFDAPHGQPPKAQAKKIARIVGLHYYGLTGRIPAKTVDPVSSEASGQFVELLRTVYKILGINKASAAAQTTVLNKEWRDAKVLAKETGKALQSLIGKN